jgi:4-hydroxybenzoate polyprenyltransferase
MWNTSNDRRAVTSTVAGSLTASEPAPAAIGRLARYRYVWHIARGLRPHHWAKNLLLFSAALLSGHPFDLAVLSQAAIAFVAFSLCASAAYVVNDVMDMKVDRLHPVKCNRPFAAGSLPAAWGLPLAAFTLCLGLLAGLALPNSFMICLLLYVLVTSLYSAWLKQLFVVDVATLASLHTLRVVAGGYATGLPISNWLLVACMLLFFSLALGKRCSELRRLASESKDSTMGRGYLVGDLAPLETVGLICGLLAGLALIIFVDRGAVISLYRLQIALWLLSPVYFYWIARFWRKANQGEPLEDPVVFVLRDPVSIAMGFGVFVWLQVATIV